MDKQGKKEELTIGGLIFGLILAVWLLFFFSNLNNPDKIVEKSTEQTANFFGSILFWALLFLIIIGIIVFVIWFFFIRASREGA